jgi:TetR/AcrR family fatty acid metabolism transcriptional regulator
MVHLTRAVNKNMKVEKKELILKASLDTFSKIGFAKATMRKIAETADIAVGTIYIYFKNKDEILQELVNRHNEEYKKLFEKMSVLKPEKAFRLFYEERFAAMAKLHNLTNLFSFEASQDKKFRNTLYKKTFEKLNNLMVKFLEASINKGEMRKVKNTAALSAVIMSLTPTLVSWKECLFSKQLKELTYAQLVDTISDLMHNGLTHA